MIKVVVGFVAPIPVGHHVTVIALDCKSLFSDEYSLMKNTMIVCDDDTRIVYTTRGIGADTMTYESIHFPPESSIRISATVPPLRGRVVSCLVRTESDYNETIFGIEPDPQR